MIDAAAQAGSNDVSGIAFTLRQDRQARDRALSEATREAVSKAQVIAQALGGRVVRIVEVQEEGFQQRPPVPIYQTETFHGETRRVATPIEVGSLDITSRVQLIAEVETNCNADLRIDRGYFPRAPEQTMFLVRREAMARYRNEMDDERDYYPREERLRRENFGAYDEPYRPRRQFDTERRPEYNRGRFGERAEYEQRRTTLCRIRGETTFRDDCDAVHFTTGAEISSATARWRDREYYAPERSRLRCRDIMTRDLAVATRDTTIPEIALMMKQEDTGVIPVVEYDVQGNGRTEAIGTKI